MISNEEKLSAVIDALKAKGGFSKFTEQSKNITGVEPQLNCALAVLKEATGICQLTNESGQWDLGLAKQEEITEGAGSVRKNNGDGSFERAFSYQSTNEAHDPYATADKLLCESLKLNPEETKQALKTLNPKRDGDVPDNLTEGQREEYRFARSIGINEADALRLVNITGGYSNYNKRASGRMLESR
jgi:hypothetical protein